MQEKHLHIICLDVPYPVNYGGVFDLFYKIKALHAAGVKIHLHCFEYGRGQQAALNAFCVEVNYYSRIKTLSTVAGRLPYIVASRASKQLLANLQKDDYPILMEGIHCTYFLQAKLLPKERCYIRLHNVEYLYYRQLYHTSSSVLKKIFFKRESGLLHAYEAALANKATAVWTVSEKDLQDYQQAFGYQSIDYLPLFLPEYAAAWNGQMGEYCLYHGNLEVAENEHAAIWLMENVFRNLDIPLIIAGKCPSKKLEKLAQQPSNLRLVANPNEADMNDLIKNAQINILPSFNNTGIKLKLINALYMGKHCLVNNAGVDGSGLNATCIISNSADEMRGSVEKLFSQPFPKRQFEERQHLLHSLFNNQRNAEQMINWIFHHEPTIPGAVAAKRQPPNIKMKI